MNPYPSPPVDNSGKRFAAGLTAIFLGPLGAHKFILGYNGEGAFLLIFTLFAGPLTCGLAVLLVWVLTSTEGVIYLTKSDEEFERLYVTNRRVWF